VVQGVFVAAYFTARRDTLCSLCETIMSQFKTVKVLTLELQRFVRGNVAHELAFDSMSRVFVTSVVVLRVQVC
jgi:hypothetical protein